MAVQKITGKGGSFVYNGATLSFTKWSADVERETADSTDSSNYDVASDMVHKAQLPVSLQTSFDVEGDFDLNSTQASLIANLYSGASAVPAIFKLSAAVTFGHGNVDVTNFKVETPLTDMVTWTATMKTNGVFTMGS